jgi:N-hydroxyarylamine O-acetyltransferase
MIDLNAYFSRIGYDGTRAPTLANLTEIHRQHARSIPFENLDVLLGRGIRIDLVSIQQKLIQQQRGGYCFEQNALLAAALQLLGFQVTSLLARVRWQVPPETETPLTHMLLRVETENGPHLCDVGFGSMSLQVPLSLSFDVEQLGSLEPRRLVRRSGFIPGRELSSGFVAQQVRIADEWLDVYQFSLEPPSAVDCEVGNWFTSTHPQSRFTQNLIVSRMADSVRYTLINREFTIRQSDGRGEKRVIESSDELVKVLSEHFSLHLPPGTRVDCPGLDWTR